MFIRFKNCKSGKMSGTNVVSGQMSMVLRSKDKLYIAQINGPGETAEWRNSSY